MKRLVAIIAVSAVTLFAVPAVSASGLWRQGVPKPADVACEDLNEYLFPEGKVPGHLLPWFGADATTKWGQSWTSGEWALHTGGHICVREVDDPSSAPAPARQSSRQPTPAPSPTYSQLTGAVFAGTSQAYAICSAGQSIATVQDLTSYPSWNTGFPYSSVTGVLTMTNNTASNQVFTLDYRCL